MVGSVRMPRLARALGRSKRTAGSVDVTHTLLFQSFPHIGKGSICWS